LSALHREQRRSENPAGDSAAGLAAYDFAAAADGNADTSSASPPAEGSAYFLRMIDLGREIDPHSPVRSIADQQIDARTAEAATSDDVAVPPGQGPSMSFRNLAGRFWRALRRLQPMFPPMSCC
jgi:hypothetical protein